jgi:hypothetical protein
MTLKATAAQGTVEDLMFNPEEYKCDFKVFYLSYSLYCILSCFNEEN